MSSSPSSARSCRCSSTAATMEAEADAMGAKLIAEAGYEPIEMANIWEQLIGEEDASARYRRKRRRRGSLFDTHPSSDARMADLRADAAEVTVPGKRLRRSAASAISRRSGRSGPTLLDDQVKLNDPGRQPVSDRDPGPGRLERPAALLRGRGLAAAQPPRRRRPRRAELCRRGRLSRCSGRRLALARHLADEGRAGRRRPRPPSPAI